MRTFCSCFSFLRSLEHVLKPCRAPNAWQAAHRAVRIFAKLIFFSLLRHLGKMYEY